MRAKTVFAVCLVVALAGLHAGHTFAGLRVRNSTDQTIEVTVTYLHWGHDFLINDTAWKELKPGEFYDPDQGNFGLGKLYFLTARYADGPRHGSMLPIRSWHRYEAGKYSIASGNAYFDPASNKSRQLNNESVLEEIQRGNWSPLTQHWPGIRLTSPVAKIMPISETFGSFQIDLYHNRFVTRICRQ
jgi:hypothetical protein